MHHRLVQPLRSRAFWFALALAFTLWALNATLIVSPVQSSLQSLWQTQGERLAEEYGQRVADLLARDDRIGLTVEVQRWSRAEDVAGVQVLDPEGQPIAQAGAREEGYDFTRPVYYEDSLLGTLTLSLQDHVLNAAQRRLTLYLLASVVLLAALGWLAWRFYFEQLWQAQARVSARLARAFPRLEPRPDSDPLHQASDLADQLEQHYEPSLQLLDQLQRRLTDNEFEQLVRAFDRLDQSGTIQEAVLVRIQLLNLAELEEDLDAPAIKRLLDRVQRQCTAVMRLYSAAGTENPWQFVLNAGPGDPDFVSRALCASQVLSDLIHDDSRQQAQFSVSVHAGPLYQGYQLNGGAPCRVVFGRATRELDLLSLYNDGPQILMSDSVLQLEALGDVVEASIYRDLTLPDSSDMEVWRLDGFAPGWQRVLERQVEVLKSQALA